MLKKSFFTLSLFLLFIFSSCSNIFSGSESYRSSIDFALGDRAARNVVETVSANEVVNDDSQLKVVCELLRGDVAISTDTKTVSLKELKNTVFNLENVLYGNNYFVSLKIYFEDILIYKALSESIELNDSNEHADINLPLQVNKSKISYELNQGEFVPGTVKPLDYFINSDVILPEPERPLFNFGGWFLNSDFTGERITKLGKNKFVGDVTLYALWTGKNEIRPVVIAPSDTTKVDFGDKITLECETPDVTIYYTTNGDIPTESSILYNPANGIIVDDSMIADGDSFVIKAFAVKDRMMPSRVAEKGYELKRYTVRFDKGRYGKETVNDIPGKKKGDVINLPKLTESDFNLDGWLDNGTRFTDTYEVSKDITLTADWREVNGVASVTFTPSQTPDSAGSVDYKQTVTLECTTPGAEIFYTTDNSSVTNISTRKKYSSGNPIVIDKDMTIKAVAEKSGRTTSQVQSMTYKVRKYTVTFDRNNHGTAPSKATNLKKGDIVTEPGTLSETGYIFGEWYKEPECANKWNFATDKIGTDNITLYAKWTPITYKVKFNINKGDEGTMAEQEFTYDVSAPLRKNTFTKSGYRFEGWGTSDSGTVAYTDEKSVQKLSSTNNATVELFAIWENIAPGPVTSFAASVSGDKIHLSWTNPTVTDVAKVVINSTDAGITNQEVDVRGKYGKTGSVDVAIGSGNLGKGTYNFTAKTVDKDNLGCISGDVKSGSITLPTIDDFSVPNGLVNKSYTVIVTGTNFKSSDIKASDFKVTAAGKKVTPSAVTINSNTELQFNIPVSSSAINDTISVSCIGATTKQDTFDIKADYNIADIVMTDDTLLTKDKYANYKGTAKPVAVIFRERAGSSSAMGIGFYYKVCIWAKSGVKGATDSVAALKTTETMGDASKDGSGNWDKLKAFDSTGTSNAAVNYPAFDFANSFGSNYSGTSYSSGWYLPSLGEVIDLGKVKWDVNVALGEVMSYVTKAVPAPMGSTYAEVYYSNMWTSNQASDDKLKACGFNLNPNNVPRDYKDKTIDGTASPDAADIMHACAVRKF